MPLPKYAQVLRAARIRQDIPSIRELARLAGISHTSIADAEKGLRPPGQRVLIALNRVLNLTPSERDVLQRASFGELQNPLLATDRLMQHLHDPVQPHDLEVILRADQELGPLTLGTVLELLLNRLDHTREEEA